MPTATNMIDTDWREMRHCIALLQRGYPPGRPSLLDHGGLRPGGPDVPMISA